MDNINEKSRDWTNEEVETLKRCLRKKDSYKEIGIKLKRSVYAIGDKARKLSVKRYPPKFYTCQWCGKKFRSSKTRNVLFCDNKCFFESKRKESELRKELTANHCMDCGKVIDKRAERCPQCNGKSKIVPLNYCIDCGEEIRKNSKRCLRCEYDTRIGRELSEETKKKISEANSGENAYQWQGGISYLPYCNKFTKEFKERVREFFDRKCYVCGKEERENNRKLNVHHVNYDKMVCCNDTEPLFVPLCDSCHSKTNHERETWEEFFTVSLEYLTHGKCYYSEEEMQRNEL